MSDLVISWCKHARNGWIQTPWPSWTRNNGPTFH